MAAAWVARIVEKRFLGGNKVRVGPLIETCLWLFEWGAVLGRARSGQVEVLAELFSEPGRAHDLAQGFREMGAGILAEVEEEQSTFFELFMARQAMKFEAPDEVGVSKAERGLSFLMALGAKTVRIETARKVCEDAFVEGLAVGVTYPELVEGLWRKSYERTDADNEKLTLLRKHGLDVPEGHDQRITLEERQHAALLDLAAFAAAYYPELMDRLQLTPS